jgi:hypothetical protein
LDSLTKLGFGLLLQSAALSIPMAIIGDQLTCLTPTYFDLIFTIPGLFATYGIPSAAIAFAIAALLKRYSIRTLDGIMAPMITNLVVCSLLFTVVLYHSGLPAKQGCSF